MNIIGLIKSHNFFWDQQMIKVFSKFIVLIFVSASAFALTHIDITRGNIEPVPIAITDFHESSNQAKKLSENIIKVVTQDLQNSGLFRIINKKAYIENIIGADSVPKFSAWRQINAASLINGSVDISYGKLTVSFRMWDPFSEKQVGGAVLEVKTDAWRRVAHKISDEIYKRLTGEDGYFDSKVVYVAVSGPANKRIKRLAVMDQDGANHHYLSDGKHLVLTPRFSPDARHFMYLSYEDPRKPRVRVMDLDTHRTHSIGSFPGMSFAPRYTSDGRNALLSAAVNGISNIYFLDLQTLKQTQLTSCNSICTSPSPSPDNSKIAFNSDMGGGRHIYVMNADGSGIKRISFGTGHYTSPVWSPRGDLIAFTKSIPGRGFYIGLMKPDGSGERIIARGWIVEGPTWSPNGRVIMFEKGEKPRGKDSSHTKLYAIDITGYNERKIDTPLEATDASWSPLLN
jgi:TolB protein